ncbi:ATP-dependent RecD-like DNA helicase [Amycolatopsis acidiphila]|uniref:AAA family ATPase n=1 Tax=Amycolatopsis acidiphila TaxID=715473 RepID=A0A558AI11_9PSEU|nr:ATP-dependent RecD-like DNA helicase [Amycolatopsis acidiphila]TVT23912.1 AAA family ATPase [Amycolatopsis acidiphila]UIJ61111.1 ATP-dependent RecD-like DNA helicase [Amycolatopsis acidiphila]GHG86709.1 helicase [Amycolatopsis acidiphila]
MTTVGDHIQSTDATICQNIASLTDQRELLSQNVLAQLRNLVEGVAVRLQLGSADADYNYPAIGLGLAFIKGRGQYGFLSRFHKLLEASASHYTMDGDASERLMLKYYEYLLRIRTLLKDKCGIEVLGNLESFPVDLDPSLREYHDKIAARIEALRSTGSSSGARDRYYIHKTRPFFVGGRIYYEVTFYRAINKVSKFDRIIAFTDIDMTDKYSAMLTLQRDSIDVLNQTMPIMIIRDWAVSIRPCEFDNFARLLGITTKVRTSSAEYGYLMRGLTVGSGSLLDLIDMADDQYEATKAAGTAGIATPQIFPVLDDARRIVRLAAPGHNVIRYLMLRMHNRTLKPQYNWDECSRLSDLNLLYGCIPFDQMPFCTSLPGHNPRYWDLVESLDATDRDHELLARRVRNNVDRHGTLYTPVADLETFGDVAKLIANYNRTLYYKQAERQLVQDKDHVFIRGYEDDTVAILEKLQEYAASGIDGYTPAVERWIDEAPHAIDDDAKKNALKLLFNQSKVAVIYGAAGTGKSTMVDHIANYFNDKTKLFLAHTNPAIDNLKRKVTAQDSTFRTISSQIYRTASDPEYDLLVIDECSTVSNADLIKVLEKTSFELLVLVGDVYQIESIQFGNWFSTIRSFIPDTSVFELTTPFRTNSAPLLGFWGKVRNTEDDIAEVIARNGYSTVLDSSLFESQRDDEIILCLNYDGLYGINNVNRFLQSSNPNPAISWRASAYKVGDPVLFNETERFRPVTYNNLKGRIVDIAQRPGQIQFDVELDRPLTEFDVVGEELEWVEGSTVRFSVYDYDTSDEDDDSLNTSVPFQVAYAVSIHKAQGLEYDSVKIVITDANEDDITHSILYTAVTRARDRLRIFWTPETQQAVLKSLHRSTNPKDVAVLTSRRDLTPVAGSRRSP